MIGRFTIYECALAVLVLLALLNGFTGSRVGSTGGVSRFIFSRLVPAFVFLAAGIWVMRRF